MITKTSDVVADFLKENKIKHIFCIIGAANAHLVDSISKLNYTNIIYVHHEQSAIMAMGAYYRASGNIAAALVTAGGGSSNAITGVVSNWADSIPGLIISGQESYKHVTSHKNLRMFGIQGFDSPAMVSKVTKYAKTLSSDDDIQYELEHALQISIDGRPGPVWIDFPTDVQYNMVNMVKWNTIKRTISNSITLETNLYKIYTEIENSKRPIIIAGAGIKLSNSTSIFKSLIEKLKIPVILTWSAIDILPSSNILNYGRSGIMGGRSANFIVQNSDLVISIGSRLSLLQTGYDPSDFAPHAKIIINDIDENESIKNANERTIVINEDSNLLLSGMLNYNTTFNIDPIWISYCNNMRRKYPILMPEHEDPLYINSYKFIDKLNNHLTGKEIIVTDMGTALLSGYYGIKLKEHNIMYTSLGLGEMGYGLPGAIGGSFSDPSRNVICLNCDGGIMMNIQELQTITHHKLPIKIIIFNNDGYLMIKHTQKLLFGGTYNGVNTSTGISFPNFRKISNAFEIPYTSIKDWENFQYKIKKFLETSGPSICEVFMNPEQDFLPKVKGIRKENGTFIAPPIEELSPLLSLQEMSENMIVGLHTKSTLIRQ